MNLQFGPRIGAQVRVMFLREYPLPSELAEMSMVPVLESDRGHVVEFDGQTFTVSLAKLVLPIRTTDGRVFCPICPQTYLNPKPSRPGVALSTVRILLQALILSQLSC